MASSRTVIVAGAGIGGLTAALAIAQRGFRVAIFDQAQRLEEVGAGIQLSPNASRILIALGLGEQLRRHVVAPEELRVMNARTARILARAPLGAVAEKRYGAPYWVIHRGDLQAVLIEAVRAHPDIVLHLGTRVEDFAMQEDGVIISARASEHRFEDRGAALIAADGLWSSLRRRLGHRRQAPLARWGKGAVTLLGDAAHPMLPYLAQGAAMAIEDAAVLAQRLADTRSDPAAAMRRYERQRRARTARAQRAARRNGIVYQLGGPGAFLRTLALTAIGGERLLARYDWLY